MRRARILVAALWLVAAAAACGGGSGDPVADIPQPSDLGGDPGGRPDPGTPDPGDRDPGVPDPGDPDPGSDAADPDATGPDATEPDVNDADLPGEDVPPADGTDPDVPADDVPPADIADPDVPADDVPPADIADPDVPADDVPPADVPLEDVPADIPAGDVPPSDPGPGDDGGVYDPENCMLTPGSSWVLLSGDLLLPEGTVRDGHLLIDATGLIACAAQDCSTHPEFAGATVIACASALIAPAMINGHDHITFTGNFPKSHGTERYDHRHEWRKALNGHTKIPVPMTFGAEAWGELRNVLAGTTSMFGSGKATGLLRNLDEEMIGLPVPMSKYDVFPLDDGDDGLMLTDSCAYPKVPSTSATAAEYCYVPHVAEGVNAAARNEFLCMAGLAPGGQDNVLENTAFIHGVALLASDIAEMAHDGTGLIWSPRTNVDLYGNTASILLYHRLGVNIGLGTDWTASGSVNMMRELACADQLNRTQFGAYFTDREIYDMATINNARAFKVDAVVGSLEPGKVADVAVFHTTRHPDLRAAIDGSPMDVALVLRGGAPLYGDVHLVPGIPGGATGCEVLDVCGAEKRVCAQRETGKTLAQLQPTGAYGLFFCEPPADEPTCVPFRPGEYDGAAIAGDADGDGIPDDQDNCPAMFNPVRPVDNGAQADADGDGEGDVCDPCPLDPDTTDCTSFDPNDRDADGIPNVSDNCPSFPNPDQFDHDLDGKGDECDACPDKPNPGAAFCPETIYDIKQGVVPVGATARIVDGIVTAVGRRNGVYQGFFVQVDPADPDYAGAPHSGLYCYGPSMNPKPVAGDRVTVDGTVGLYWGQIQHNVRAVAITASGLAAPAPADVAPADVATGGALAAAYESVLVRVSDVTTLDVNPAAGGGDTAPINEFVVTGDLRVNDFVYLLDPFPLVGDQFASIAGVLRWANDHSKIEPRGEFDAVRRNLTPTLASFGPAQAYALEGETAVPLPGLAVRLQRPVDSDTFVAIASDAPDAAVVPGGGVTVPAGLVEATVPVEALAQAASVTLTATLDAVALDVALRVVGPLETPVPIAVTPDPLALTLGDAGKATVTLDIPTFGAAVDLIVAADPEGIVDVPTLVTVPQGGIAQTFDVTGVAEGSALVALEANGGTATFQVDVSGGPDFPRLFFSEYLEGSSFNKALEVFNNTAAPVPLSSCTVRLYSNGAAAPSQSVTLGASGDLAPGAAFVLCHASAAPAILSVCGRQDSAVVNFNGDDAIDLVCDGQVVDVIGRIGTDPGDAWIGSGGLASTKDRTLRRKCGITHGDPDGSDPFDPDAEWDSNAVDTFDGLGAHAVACP